ANADAVADSGNQSCLKPALALTKTAGAATYTLGDTISFTIVVTNTGQGTAHNVRYNPLDSLPDPNHTLNWGPASPTATCNGQSGPAPTCTVTGAAGSQTLNCNFGTLAPNGNCSVTVASATQTTDPGDCVPAPGLNNSATAVDDEGDTANASASQSCKLPNLVQTKTPNKATYTLGDTVSFTIVVTNNGAGTAHNVRYNPLDSLPDPNSSLNWGP